MNKDFVFKVLPILMIGSLLWGLLVALIIPAPYSIIAAMIGGGFWGRYVRKHDLRLD